MGGKTVVEITIRHSICVLVVSVWPCTGCRSNNAPDGLASSAPSVQAFERVGTVCDETSPLAIELKSLQGKWKVVSSSGQAGQGHVFLGLIGETLLVKGATLVVPDHAFDAEGNSITLQTTKTITLTACTLPQAIDLKQTPDAKGWSRTGVAALEGNRLTLTVQFPGLKRPESLAPANDGREVSVLERVP